MTTIVSAPGNLIVATNDGLKVQFGGVETPVEVPAGARSVPGEQGIRVYLQVIRCLETQRRDQAFDTEMELWGTLLTSQGKESAGPPPSMPGAVALNTVRIELSDDAGGTYRYVAGQVAGTGTEWDGSFVYVPIPPTNVRHLNLEFSLDGVPTGKSCRVRVD
jgi:hypothetical protein